MDSKKLCMYWYKHALIPKGQMLFREFELGSYGMNLMPNFFIILELVLLFEIYSDMRNDLYIRV